MDIAKEQKCAERGAFTKSAKGDITARPKIKALWEAIEAFGNSQLSWLQKHFPYTNGTPSDTTLASVFSALNVENVNECFISWIKSKLL